MLRRFFLILAVLILTGVMIGCAQSTQPNHTAQVVGSDARLMLRDAGVILGLDRSGIYNRYDSPCYVDGH